MVNTRLAAINVTKPNLTLEDSYEALRSNFLDVRSRSGANIISASGGMQFAYERGDVGNGLFTHALLAGLQGSEPDLNGDDQVDIAELFRYVSSEVVRLSQGRQVPSVRSEPLFGGFALQ